MHKSIFIAMCVMFGMVDVIIAILDANDGIPTSIINEGIVIPNIFFCFVSTQYAFRHSLYLHPFIGVLSTLLASGGSVGWTIVCFNESVECDVVHDPVGQDAIGKGIVALLSCIVFSVGMVLRRQELTELH